MNAKTFLSILILSLLFTSCEIRIQDNRRLVITGEIQDQNGQPLSGINVISGDDFVKLGSKKTAEDGSFLLTSLSLDNGDFNSDDDFISHRINEININATDNESDFRITTANDQFSRIRITNDEVFNDVEVDLGTIVLNEISEVSVTVDKGSFADEELEVFHDNFDTVCNFELEDILDNNLTNIDYNLLNCGNTTPFLRSRDLPAEDDILTFDFLSLKGVPISISIVDSANETIFNQEFDINETNETIDISL